MTSRRLPPGQRETAKFPVLDLGDQPNLGPRDWSLTVQGAVERPIRWTWETFLAQPQSSVTADIHCVTSWSRFGDTWEGVTGATLMGVIRPRPEAVAVMLRSFDGYSTNLPLADFARDDVLLAHSWNGAPLTREHGGPVRAMVPHLYFWKSAKWLRHVTVLTQDTPGYWEARGYHMRGDPWKEQRNG